MSINDDVKPRRFTFYRHCCLSMSDMHIGRSSNVNALKFSGCSDSSRAEFPPSQSKGLVVEPRPLTEPLFVGKSINLNSPGKRQSASFCLPPIVFPQLQKMKKCMLLTNVFRSD